MKSRGLFWVREGEFVCFHYLWGCGKTVVKFFSLLMHAGFSALNAQDQNLTSYNLSMPGPFSLALFSTNILLGEFSRQRRGCHCRALQKSEDARVLFDFFLFQVGLFFVVVVVTETEHKALKA